MQDLAVKQSPGEEINRPSSMPQQVSFPPAEVNGVPVAVKVLIGNPVA